MTRVEGMAANDDDRAMARRNALGNLNRRKFTARWGRILGTAPEEDICDVRALLPPMPVSPWVGKRPVAALFTPYYLTPGGGERYLLSLASTLAVDHDITLVTSSPYSHLRLVSVLRELGIEPFVCRMLDETAFATEDPPSIMVTLGNHVVPPVVGRGAVNLFICQFPFPLEPAAVQRDSHLLDTYDAVLTYSTYAQAHVIAVQSASQLPIKPIEVLYPPVSLGMGDVAHKKRMIVSVGRFFSGGHSKRHDLMIEAFGRLLRSGVEDVELHLAGSFMPDHISYLEQLRAAVGDMPVFFHINASKDKLAELYADAAIYWHAAGLGADLARGPEQAEHFGISIVEAMSSGCVPLAFSAGGPREIIRHDVDGYLYANSAELVDLTRQLLSPAGGKHREVVGIASRKRAQAFSTSMFDAAVRLTIQRYRPARSREVEELSGSVT